MLMAANDTESPHGEESAIVQQALALMGGSLQFHSLQDGALTTYVLLGSYRIMAFLHGLTPLDYAARAFFDGQEHYFLARVGTATSLSVLALVAFRSFHRQLGAAPALLVASLLGLPFLERLAPGARIDIPQAAFQGAALLALAGAISEPRLRHWVVAGACAGFAIATHTLPGLLVMPCFLLASFFASAQTGGGTARNGLGRLRATVFGPGLWLAMLAAAACAAVGNPALLDARQVLEDQAKAIAEPSGPLDWATRSVAASFEALELPFQVSLAASVVFALVKRDRRALLVLSFILIYSAALWDRTAHDHMVAAAVASCLSIGYGFAALIPRAGASRSLHRWARWSWLPVALALVAPAFAVLWPGATRVSDRTLARRWIHRNVPSGTGIFQVGACSDGPRLVAANLEDQEQLGGYFAQGRRRDAFLDEAFRRAHAAYVGSGRPIYSLQVHDRTPRAASSSAMQRWVTDSLVKRARRRKQRYIVLSGYAEQDVRSLGYRWFAEAVLRQQFRSIAIFEVPGASGTQSAAPANPDEAPPPR